MKKFFITLSAAVIALTSFTSCDSDEVRGMELSGEWQGHFGMYYEIECRQHGIDRYYADQTYIKFLPSENTYSAGTGYQIDYYYNPDSPYDEVYHYFRWQVNYGQIRLTYRDECEWNTTIRDYDLSNSYFSGYFDYSNNTFKLAKLSSFRWNDYDSYWMNGYYEHDRYGWGWHAGTRSGNDQDSICTEKPRILRQGNAFADGIIE